MEKYEPLINSYIHCKQCLDNRPKGISPRDWADNEVGFTKKGIQVFCKRHNINIVHIDFEGHKHPADISHCGEIYEKIRKEEKSK